MAIYKKGKYYYCKFMHEGVQYHKSTKCRIERDAIAFEREIVDKLRQQGSAKALVENFRDVLTGGTRIRLDEAFERFVEKPRKERMSKNCRQLKEMVWLDFLAFISARHGETVTLNQVTLPMVEGYLHYLRQHGKFVKAVSYQTKAARSGTAGYARTGGAPSCRTWNFYLTVLREIFGKLMRDAGLAENSFAHIEKMKSDTEEREPFSVEELKLIAEKAEPFVYAIFMLGCNTGLREGDICTLRWSEVDLAHGVISRKMLKTGKTVRIPLLVPLRAWLEALPREGEYVLPEHAAMYLSNSSGISYRVKKFLEGIGLTTTRLAEGRSRAVSVKDVHSLRHTFVYMASSANVPFHVVKAIVGHVDSKMTEHYANHVNDELAKEKMGAMPVLFGVAAASVASSAPEAVLPPPSSPRTMPEPLPKLELPVSRVAEDTDPQEKHELMMKLGELLSSLGVSELHWVWSELRARFRPG